MGKINTPHKIIAVRHGKEMSCKIEISYHCKTIGKSQ